MLIKSNPSEIKNYSGKQNKRSIKSELFNVWISNE